VPTWFKSLLVLTSTAACAAVVLGMGFGKGETGRGDARVRTEAKQVTARFLNALDQGHYTQACSLLAKQFYRRHHVPGRTQCATGLAMGMGGTAVRFRITGVDVHGKSADVHAVVDGDPGVVVLVREAKSLRVLDQRAA
jgi:hypothetical protein